MLPLTLHQAANVALAHGDPERAAPFVEESLAVWRALRDRRGMARALRNLALVARQRGDCGRAAALCRESLVLFREAGDKRGILLCFQRLAGIAWDQGRGDGAARLSGAADALRDAMGLRRPFTYEVEGFPDDLAGLRAALGEAGAGARSAGYPAELGVGGAPGRFGPPRGYSADSAGRVPAKRVAAPGAAGGPGPRLAAAWAEGRAMTLEQAVEYALEEACEG